MNDTVMSPVATELHPTLQSTAGRVGTQRLLPAGTEIAWSAPGEDAIRGLMGESDEGVLLFQEACVPEVA